MKKLNAFEKFMMDKIEEIDRKLATLDKDINNHVHTIGKEMGEMNQKYAGLNQDILWLKNLREEECLAKLAKQDDKESKEDIQTHTKVGMFEKLFWIIATALIGSMIGFIISKLFVK